MNDDTKANSRVTNDTVVVCAWCGRIAIDFPPVGTTREWILRPDATPLVDFGRISHGVCDSCETDLEAEPNR
jgi:hypothetical protein